MKGRSIRPKQEQRTSDPSPMARIVRSAENSWLDSFIPLENAKEMYDEGRLYEVDLGPAYPNSYCRV